MVDITHKVNTLRKATAQASIVVSNQNTIDAIKNNTVPKGDVFTMAKAAGLFAVKQTHQVIPDCHPLPIEFASIDYQIEGLQVIISVTIKTIYKTGVEVEAMHGASVVALTMYDMLKPIDSNVEIERIRLLEKSGGKSSFKTTILSPLKASVVVCSESITSGKKADTAGKAITKAFNTHGIEVINYEIIPEDIDTIRSKAMTYIESCQFVIFCGGTGLTSKDVTPDALIPILERRIPGAEETIRRFGQDRTPHAMLSRSVVGMINNSMVMALPGSTNGAIESIQAIFPHIMHVFKTIRK